MPNNEGSATKSFVVPNNALPATTQVPNNATLFYWNILCLYLQALVADKKAEYESNLRIDKEKVEELAYWKQKMSDMQRRSNS